MLMTGSPLIRGKFQETRTREERGSVRTTSLLSNQLLKSLGGIGRSLLTGGIKTRLSGKSLKLEEDL